MYDPSLARATPVWKNRGLVTALHATGFCGIFATELEDRRPKTVPYLEEVVE